MYSQVSYTVNTQDIYHKVNSGVQSPHMDVYEIRRTRLRELIVTRFAGRQVDLANAIGRQPDYISRCVNGKTRIGDLARTIERELDLPIGWLDTISGEKPPEVGFFQTPSLAPEAENQTLDQTPRMLNVLDWNDAPHHESATSTRKFFEPPQCKPGAYWLQMPDDSMRETLPPGAMLLIEPFYPGSQIEDNTAYVLQTPVGVVCRRVKAGVSGWMLVQEDGRNAPPEPLTDAVRIVGEVAMQLKLKP